MSYKTCQRCQNIFSCKPFEIEACDCSKVKLEKETLDFLKETYYDCLCNDCLTELDKLVQDAHYAPMKSTEGIHYNMEDGLLVFSSTFLIQRGYCCGSGCRHCPYGYVTKKE